MQKNIKNHPEELIFRVYLCIVFFDNSGLHLRYQASQRLSTENKYNQHEVRQAMTEGIALPEISALR